MCMQIGGGEAAKRLKYIKEFLKVKLRHRWWWDDNESEIQAEGISLWLILASQLAIDSILMSSRSFVNDSNKSQSSRHDAAASDSLSPFPLDYICINLNCNRKKKEKLSVPCRALQIWSQFLLSFCSTSKKKEIGGQEENKSWKIAFLWLTEMPRDMQWSFKEYFSYFIFFARARYNALPILL